TSPLSVSLSLSPFLSPCLCLPVLPLLCLSLSLSSPLSVSLSFSPYLSLSLSLSLPPCPCPCLCVPACLPVLAPVCVSLPVSGCLQDGDLDTTQVFLQASDSKHLEKKPGRRKRTWLGLGLVLGAGAVALLTGMLVWHFHLRSDVRVKKLYIGQMGINNQRYQAAYEDPSSSEFSQLAGLVSTQLKLIYSKNSVLAKSFKGSTVHAFRYASRLLCPVGTLLRH
ncbi:hypothetical protein PFLUV_G00064560, partial [Perca fluviatilis]